MSDTDMDLPEKGPGIPGHEDGRPDIVQAVEARSDAVARGEGGDEPDTFTKPGEADGVGGTGGEVKNDTQDQHKRHRLAGMRSYRTATTGQPGVSEAGSK